MGRYATDEWSVRVNTSDARPWSARANARGADSFGGTVRAVGGELGLAPSSAFAVSAGLTRNDVELPSGSFTSDIYTLNLTWALSTLVTTNALLQYNALDEELVTNVRFNFIHRPGSDVFVVFTEDRGVEGDVGTVADRGLVVKATWLVRF